MKELLTDDHLELDELFDRLFVAVDSGDVTEVHKHLDLFWARLAMHIRAENLHLFPSILRAARFEVNDGPATELPTLDLVEKTILDLDNDHSFFMRELGDAVKQVFEMRDNRADNGDDLSSLRERFLILRGRLKLHNEVEESLVYLWGEDLSPTELPLLSSKIQKELENLPPRFRELET
jgi:hypothetical protein